MAETTNRRHRMFIDTREQILFATRSTVHVAIFILAGAILLYGPGESGMRLSDVQHTTNEFLYYQGTRLWLLVPALALVWLISVIGSHRVVGPVFGFKKALSAVRQGDYTVRLFPRKGDHFSELAATINATLDQQRRTLEQLREQARVAREALGDTGSETPEKLNKARDAVNKMHDVLRGYTL